VEPTQIAFEVECEPFESHYIRNLLFADMNTGDCKTMVLHRDIRHATPGAYT